MSTQPLVTTFNGPRYGRDAQLERNGMAVTQTPCDCATCVDMGPWLSEKHFHVTFEDGVTMSHVPARWLKIA